MSSDRYDTPWKRILEHFFEPAMAFFFPQIHEAVDWSHEIVFMDKDLEKALHDAEFGVRRVDKLVKVRLKNGKERYLYIHIEVQNQYEAGFSKRLFLYYYRLVDHVTSLAILGDERPHWKPNTYEADFLGMEVRFRYPTVKLLDYLAQWETLETHPNPFAMVVMAHLNAQPETILEKDSKKNYI